MGPEYRERTGLPLLSDFQNCASTQGVLARILIYPSITQDSSQLPPPDALGWAKEPILPWVQIPHWQLTGEGDGLVETVVGLMEFHRLNLGFLACKGLSEKRVYHRKLAKRGEYWRGRARREESDGMREGTDQRGSDEEDTDDGEWRDMHR